MNKIASMTALFFMAVFLTFTTSSCRGDDETPSGGVKPNVPEYLIGRWLQDDLVQYGIIDGWEFEQDNIYKLTGSIRTSITELADDIVEDADSGFRRYEIRVGFAGAADITYCFNVGVLTNTMQEECLSPPISVMYNRQ